MYISLAVMRVITRGNSVMTTPHANVYWVQENFQKHQPMRSGRFRVSDLQQDGRTTSAYSTKKAAVAEAQEKDFHTYTSKLIRSPKSGERYPKVIGELRYWGNGTIEGHDRKGKVRRILTFKDGKIINKEYF